MLRAVIYWIWNLKPEQIEFTSEAVDACLGLADEMSEAFGYAVDVPLVSPSDFRNTLARISAAIAGLLLSTDGKFTRLMVRKEHAKMAGTFLSRIYSHDSCSLDDYSGIQKACSQLTDYEDVERVFLEKQENERYDHKSEGIFSKAVYILRVSEVVKRDALAEQVGCGADAISKVVKVLKRFNLIDSSRDGYVKKPKFNKFIRRFLKKHPDFFAA